MLLYLFLLFFWMTSVGFGGANGILPILYNELVVIKGLFSPSEFVDLIAISQITPGPILINAATYAGLKVYGIPGAIVTTLGVLIPTFIILTLLMILKNKSPNLFNLVKESFRPLALSLLFLGILILSITILFPVESGFSPKALFLIFLSFILVKFWQVPSLFIFFSLGIISVLIDFIM